MPLDLHADLILRDGRIWRGREDGFCEALAVWQGKVLATGETERIMELRGPDTEVVDLEGRFACPGLIDNHLHLIATGLVMGWVDATPEAAPTLDALLAAIRERAAETPRGAGCWRAATTRCGSTRAATPRATTSTAPRPIIR